MAPQNSPENMWIKFFTDAGLPAGVGATYALTFTDNRIQMNMLLDLNKEYLTEMGITCMGDVIAILRHAKQVHEETARDRVLGITGPKVPVAAVAGRPGQPKPITPASRILEHYIRNPPQNTATSNSMATVKERLGSLRITATKRKVAAPSQSEDKLAMDIERQDDMIIKQIRQTVAQKNIYDVPATNNVSEFIPQKSSASNVFLRLGKNDEGRQIFNSDKSKVSVVLTKKPTPTSITKTVFSRLGDKGSNDNTVASRRDSSDNEPLKYEGILKAQPAKKMELRINKKPVLKTIKVSGTMRADEAPVSVREKLPLSHPQRKSVKFSPHVDYKDIEKRSSSDSDAKNVKPQFPVMSGRTVALTSAKTMYPSAKKRTPITAVSNVKLRLGKNNFMKKHTVKAGVFGRLGVTSK